MFDRVRSPNGISDGEELPPELLIRGKSETAPRVQKKTLLRKKDFNFLLNITQITFFLNILLLHHDTNFECFIQANI